MNSFAIIFIILLSNLNQEIEEKNVQKFIRVEIDYGPFHSLKIFEDGLLCESTNSKSKTVYDFYPLRDLDYEKFSKLQKYLHLHETVFFEMDSVVENPQIKISSYQPDILLIKESKIKKIEWLSGNNENLKTLFDLINDLIPKKSRELYKIRPF